MKQRLSILLFALTILLTQWGLLAHQFAEHEHGHVCELCVVAASHQDILPSSAPLLSSVQHLSPYLGIIPAVRVHTVELFSQPIRAPPRSFLA